MEQDKNKAHFYDLRYEVVTDPGEDIRKHISNTILGTPGGMLYRLKDSIKKLDELKNPFFLTLRKGHRLLGTVGLVHRMVKNANITYSSYYVRYFSIFAPMRSKSRSKKKESPKRNLLLKQSNLKEKIVGFFNNMHDLNDKSMDKEIKTISYAFIEKENYRSMDFSSMIRYETVRELNAIFFSRFFPKEKKNVGRILPEEREKLIESLKEMYSEYTMFFTDNLFYNDQYFVLRQGDEIVAGVQANPVEFEIFEMPGFTGKVLMNILPKLPLLSRLFQPGKFRFAAFEGIYYKPGHERFLIPLFESVCAKYGMNIGVTWLDNGSMIFHHLKKIGRMGFFGKLKKTVPGAVRLKFFNVPEEERMNFCKKPAYISAYDIT